jgi:hypothetical protein
MPLLMTTSTYQAQSSFEQGPNTMSKVQLGTFAVIYELLNAHEEDMDIEPMIMNLSRSSDLVYLTSV